MCGWVCVCVCMCVCVRVWQKWKKKQTNKQTKKNNTFTSKIITTHVKEIIQTHDFTHWLHGWVRERKCVLVWVTNSKFQALYTHHTREIGKQIKAGDYFKSITKRQQKGEWVRGDNNWRHQHTHTHTHTQNLHISNSFYRGKRLGVLSHLCLCGGEAINRLIISGTFYPHINSTQRNKKKKARNNNTGVSTFQHTSPAFIHTYMHQHALR